MEKKNVLKYILMLIILFGVMFGINNYSFGKHWEVPEKINNKYCNDKWSYGTLQDYDNIFCIEEGQPLKNDVSIYRYYRTIQLEPEVAYIVKNYSGKYYRRRKRSYA